MSEVYVNKIYIQNGVTNGIIVLDKTIAKSIPLIYPEKTQKIFFHYISQKQDFHSIDRFAQFVALFQFSNKTGISIKLSDYHNDIDVAIDEYAFLQGKEWETEDRDKIMRIVLEIKEDQTFQRVKLIVQDAVD